MYASLYLESPNRYDFATINIRTQIGKVDSPPTGPPLQGTTQSSQYTSTSFSDSTIVYLRHGIAYFGDPEIQKIRYAAFTTALL
ncbi:MAG: hypothetical protein GXO48_07390 [Chlorobi bacterium]|nr:hypothetical protein [Chlorobiota bacterium]